jgi:hypothetical protein
MSSKIVPTPDGAQVDELVDMPGVVPSNSPRPASQESRQNESRGSARSILKKDGAASQSVPLKKSPDASPSADVASLPLSAGQNGDASSGMGSPGSGSTPPSKRRGMNARVGVEGDDQGMKSRIQKCPAYKKIAEGLMLQVTTPDIEDLFAIFDMNTDGQLDPKELKVAFAEGLDDTNVQGLLEKALATADTDNSGLIDAEEFRQCIRLGSETNVKAMAQRMRGLAVATNDADSWIYRENLVSYLEEKREMMENCRSLPATLAFFVLFFYLVSSHLNLNTLNKIGTAVRGQINESKLYLETDFPTSIRKVVQSRAEMGSVAEYNKVIGGLRVSVPYESAGEPSAWWFHSPYGPLCDFSKSKFAKELATTAGQVSINPKKPDVCEEWAENSTAWMLWPLQESDARAILGGPTGKETGWPTWASGYVDHLNVDFIMKNEEIGFYTLVHIEVYVEPTGLTRSYSRVESFNSNPVWLNMKKDGENVDTVFVMMFDIAFLLMFLVTAVTEIVEVLVNLCKLGCKKGFSVCQCLELHRLVEYHQCGDYRPHLLLLQHLSEWDKSDCRGVPSL